MQFWAGIVVVLSASSVLAGPAGSNRVNLKEIVTVTKSEPVKKYVGGNEVISATCASTLTLMDATCTADYPQSMKNNFKDLFLGHDRQIFTKTTIITENQIKRAECRALNMRPQDVVSLTLQVECSAPAFAQK